MKEAEERLKVLEKKYHALFNATGTATLVVGSDTTIRSANEECFNVTGYFPGELIGKKWTDFVFEEDLQRMLDNHKKRRVDPASAPKKYEVRLYNSRGELRYAILDIEITPGMTESIVSIIDITDSKIVLEELKRSEDKYRLLVEYQKDLVVKIDVDGKFEFVSKSYCDLLGKKESELLGKEFYQLVHEDDLELTKREMDKLFKPPYECYVEQRAKTVKGWRWFAWTDKAILNDENEVVSIVGSGRDITEQKETETALKESEERFELAMQASQDGLFDWDLVKNEIYYSPGWKKMLGYEADELPDDFSVWEKLTDPQDVADSWKLQKEVISKKKDRFIKEFKMKHKNGHWVDILSRGEAVFNEKGEAVRLVGTHTDITERKRAQNGLERKSKDLKALLEFSQLLTETLDMDSLIDIIVERSVKIKGLDSGALYMLEGDELRLEAAFPQLRPDFPGEFRRAKLSNHPHIEKAITAGEPYIIFDTHKSDLSESEKNICEVRNLRSLLYLPLFSKGKVIGVLILGTTGRTYDFTEESIEPYKIFSNLCETALENVRLFQELKDEIADRKIAQRELKISEEKFRSVFENAQIGIYRTRLSDGKLILANQRMAELFGYDNINEAIDNYVTSEHYVEKDTRTELIGILKEKGRFDNFEAALTDANGKVRWYQYSGRFYEEEGFIEGIASEITDRKLYENELNKRNKFIETVLDNLPIGIALNQIEEGRATYMNKKFEEIYGWPADELVDIELFFNKVYPDESYRSEIQNRVLSDITSGDPEKMKWKGMEITCKDGSKKIINAANIPLQEQNTMVSTVIDVTKEKKAEKELKESENKYKTLVENAPDAIAIHQNGKLVFANESAAELLEADNSDELIGVDISTIVQHDHRESVRERVDLILNEGGNFYLIEEEYVSLKGKRIPVEVTAVKILFNNEPAVQVIVRDISERKNAERALKESEERFKLFMNNIPAGIFIKDSQGRYEFVNRFNELTFDMKDWSGKTAHDFFAKEIADKFSEQDQIILERDKYSTESVVQTKENKKLFFHSQFFTITKVDDTKLIAGISSDVTDQRRAMQALKESEERLRAFFESSVVGTLVADLSGRILQANDRFLEIIGYNRSDLLSGDLNWSEITPAWFKELERRKIKEAKTYGSCKPYEKQYIRKDGTLIWTLIGYVLVGEDKNEAVEFVLDIDDRKNAEAEIRKSNANLRSIFNTTEHGYLLLDEDMVIRDFNRVENDITFLYSGLNLERNKSILTYLRKEEADKFISNFESALSKKTVKVLLETGEEKNINRWYEMIYNPVMDEAEKVYGVLVATINITEQKKNEAKLIEYQETLRKLYSHLEEVREEERKIISREIHDNLGQSLTALKIDVNNINKNARNPGMIIKKTEQMDKLILDTIRSVQKLSTTLRPELLDNLGLFAAIEWLAEDFQERTAINCRLDIPEESTHLNEEKSLALFRILQESLTNVLRHSKATEVKIVIKIEGNFVNLTVEDNGIGIPEGKISHHDSLGLIGMRERALYFEGEFEVKSRGNEGTKISVKLPV